MAKDISIARYGVINVPMAVFWSKPGEIQSQDISNLAAADPARWAGNLNTEERLWLVGKVDTTALYGEAVAILEQQGDWLKVAAVKQPTVQNKLGYPGWILTKQIGCHPADFNDHKNQAEAVVSKPKAGLFADSALTNSRGQLSYQTRLPILKETENYLEVQLPDETAGYLARRDIHKESELFFDGKNIVQEARQFLGLPYLWGGTSSWGFDCSGFMFRLYQSQGILIPRDASEQAEKGTAVEKEHLQAGDLLFFAKDRLKEKIHHVGMYIGEGLMIHSPNSKSLIRIEAYQGGVYGEEFWGARRYC
ncbi:MAG TPA: NlpC/P60 family protein [Firmicutes bacterium]|nr:NlpC/P60 family protein [Bacillota bacterium]